MGKVGNSNDGRLDIQLTFSSLCFNSWIKKDNKSYLKTSKSEPSWDSWSLY